MLMRLFARQNRTVMRPTGSIAGAQHSAIFSWQGQPAALSATGSVLRTGVRVTFCFKRKALFIAEQDGP